MPAHLLGPHVVGKRVVVRRLVPGDTGPTGGPAFTDLLGICESWADGVAVIRPETGAPVSIPISLIVSGKPVPPRPSVRARVSARDAERHAAALFPGVEVTGLGDWSIRWEPHPAGRLRKRANSCLAMGSPGLPVPEALARVAEFYGGRERDAIAQVEQGSDVETAVAEAGWSAIPGDSVFLLAAVASVQRRLGSCGALESSGGPETPQLTVTTPDAHGQAGLDGDWVGLHGLYVEPAARRRGLARSVIAALLGAAAERGATTVWLHVETDNDPALALYDSLGFAEHHRCRYYVPPAR